MTKSLKAFFSMSANEQEPGQWRKTALFGRRLGLKCKRRRRFVSDRSGDEGGRAEGQPASMMACQDAFSLKGMTAEHSGNKTSPLTFDWIPLTNG